MTDSWRSSRRVPGSFPRPASLLALIAVLSFARGFSAAGEPPPPNEPGKGRFEPRPGCLTLDYGGPTVFDGMVKTSHCLPNTVRLSRGLRNNAV